MASKTFYITSEDSRLTAAVDVTGIETLEELQSDLACLFAVAKANSEIILQIIQSATCHRC